MLTELINLKPNNMKKSTKLLIAVVLLVVAGYFGYNYMYHDHRDIASEAAKVELKADALTQLFIDNQGEEVLNSTVLVSGVITEMDSQSITLNNAVQCSFDGELPEVAIGDELKVKGRCIGYDDLFEIVKLDQSSLVK